MKRYFYLESSFCKPYSEMIVSQETDIETPNILIYECRPGFEDMWMAHYPAFTIEYVRDTKGWEKLEDCITYIPADVMYDFYELGYEGSMAGDLPSGFYKMF